MQTTDTDLFQQDPRDPRGGSGTIRMVLLGLGFVAITVALILLQPTAQRPGDDFAPEVQPVTRADTEFETLRDVTQSIADPEPQAPAPAQTAAPPTTGDSPLEALVIEALRQGQSDQYIDALVNHAAENGTIEVPGSLITPDGRVDTTTLLTVLSKAPDAMRHGAQLYVVRPGDSLASIAFRFYGTTDRAPDIFAANSELMGSPRNIAVGQELVIPAN